MADSEGDDAWGTGERNSQLRAKRNAETLTNLMTNFQQQLEEMKADHRKAAKRNRMPQTLEETSLEPPVADVTASDDLDEPEEQDDINEDQDDDDPAELEE